MRKTKPISMKQCIRIIKDAGGEWITTEDLTKELKCNTRSVFYIMSCVRELQKEYNLFPYVLHNNSKGYRWRGTQSTAKIPDCFVEFVKKRGDWVTGPEIAREFGFTKTYVNRIMSDQVKKNVVASKRGGNGGYKYIGGMNYGK